MSSVIPFLIWALLVSVELVWLARRLLKQAKVIEDMAYNSQLQTDLLVDCRRRLEALEQKDEP
jgi:hypothetical protein